MDCRAEGSPKFRGELKTMIRYDNFWKTMVSKNIIEGA
jgi:hypothetical protein